MTLFRSCKLGNYGFGSLFTQCSSRVQASAQSPLYSIVPHLLLLLAHSPANQKLIVSELSKVNLKTALTTSHLTSFKHLNACVLEALRTLPPQAVSYNRSSNENAYKLPGGGGQWSLPKGCHIAVDLLSTMRNENSFGQDRNAFVPSRFASFEYVPTDEISKADNVKTLKAALEDTPAPIQAAFMPFGNGHFGCPAQRLALSVTKVAVAEVVRRFELTPVKGREGIDASGVVGTMEEFSYQQSGVLKHVDGAPVSLKRRK
ncbi:cytochrome P450 [Chytriomyces sp. MP71]|nr:cytochrome P450 [Chytriomyces sp. MP71]